jgi:hypothetical protein
MAQQKVGVELIADTKSLRSQLREATQELIKIQGAFGEYSKEALEAARNVAQLKDRIQEAKETVELFDPGKKLQAVSGVVNAVAGAYAGLQGAMGLVGVESAEVEKQLLKVQSALALSQGISTFLDSAKDFQRLGAIIKTQVVTAFSTLRGAIIATGVGALAVGLGLLIANFDKVKETLTNLFPGLGRLASFIGDIVEKVTDYVGITSQADRALELFETNSKNRKATLEKELKVLEARGASESKLVEIRKKVAQEEINILEAKQRNGKKLSEDEAKALDQQKTNLLVIDATYNKKLLDAQKAKNEEYLKKKEEADQKEIELENKKFTRLGELSKQGKTEQENKLNELNAQYALDLELFEGNQSALFFIFKKYQDARFNLEKENRATLSKEEEAEIDKKLESLTLAGEKEVQQKVKTNTMLTSLVDRSIKVNEQANKKDLTNKQLTETAKLDLVANTLNSASTLIGKQTVAGKALAVAYATIDTYRSANLALATLPPPYGAIVAGVNIASGLANVSSILSTQVPGSGGGGSVPSIQAPLTPQFQATAPTALAQESLNQINNVAVKAYVVESDITNSQQRIQRLEQSAKI